MSDGDDTQLVTVEPHRTRVQFGESGRRGRSRAVAAHRLDASDRGGLRFEMLSPRSDGSFAIRKAAGETIQLSLRTAAGVQVRQAVLSADFDAPVLRLDLPETRVQSTSPQGRYRRTVTGGGIRL